MELKEGTYEIPDELVAYLQPGHRVIIVKRKRDNRIKEGDYRCKDCKHRGRGLCYAVAANYSRNCVTDVCLKRPKNVASSAPVYYKATDNQKACELFELK